MYRHIFLIFINENKLSTLFFTLLFSLTGMLGRLQISRFLLGMLIRSYLVIPRKGKTGVRESSQQQVGQVPSAYCSPLHLSSSVSQLISHILLQFSQYMLNIHCMPGMELGSRDRSIINKIVTTS